MVFLAIRHHFRHMSNSTCIYMNYENRGPGSCPPTASEHSVPGEKIKTRLIQQISTNV